MFEYITDISKLILHNCKSKIFKLKMKI